MKRFIFVLALFLLSLEILNGATVIKKNGTILKGQVIDQNESELRLKLPTEETILIPKSELFKISYQDLSESEAEELMQNAKKSSSEPKQSSINVNQILKTQNEQIMELTAEVISLSEELENQKARIEKLESQQKKMQSEGFGSPPKKIQWSVVWRSAFFPGWGQLHWKEYFTGGFYSLAFLGASANYNDKWQDYQKAEKRYQDPLNDFFLASNGLFFLNFFPPLGGERQELKRAATSSNEAGQILAGIYVLNLIDAFLPRSELQKDDSAKVGWDFSLFRESGFSANSGNWESGYSGNIQYRLVFQ